MAHLIFPPQVKAAQHLKTLANNKEKLQFLINEKADFLHRKNMSTLIDDKGVETEFDAELDNNFLSYCTIEIERLESLISSENIPNPNAAKKIIKEIQPNKSNQYSVGDYALFLKIFYIIKEKPFKLYEYRICNSPNGCRAYIYR